MALLYKRVRALIWPGTLKETQKDPFYKYTAPPAIAQADFVLKQVEIIYDYAA